MVFSRATGSATGGAERASGRLGARAAAATALVLLAAAPAAVGDGRLLREVVFTDDTELASNSELARRLLSPLAAARLAEGVRRAGGTMAGQPIRIADERFLVYLPSRPLASGYALLVFVPPWEDARLPQGWGDVLDRAGVIFVSAARSGNSASVIGRRAPLALLAARNLMNRHAVDPARVYVAGFSGGARVALRLALGYPDLFRGAILNAGSDPIGTRDVPLPPRDLLYAFQTSSRLVFVTGERDTAHAADDLVSARSLRQWCMFHGDGFLQARAGHEVAMPTALSRALGLLSSELGTDLEQLAACRAGIDAALDAQLRHIESLVGEGRRPAARKALADADERYGGLAAPRSVELASAL